MNLIRALIYRWSGLIVVVFLVLTIVGFFSDQWWVAELAVNFRLQYLVGFLVLLLVFSLFRRPMWVILTVIGCLINGYFVWTVFAPKEMESFSGPTIRVATFNVSMWSQRWDRVPRFFQSQDNDIVFLTEFSGNWSAYFKSLEGRYPYRIEKPAGHPFGFALLSRYPILDWQIKHLQPGNTPYLRATLSVDDRVFQLLGVHFFSPIRKQMIELRNRQIAYFTQQIKDTAVPTLLLGDLNVTPFSAHYRRMVADSPFDDKTKELSVVGTWPSVPAPFRIMIDHCLATQEFVFVTRYEGDSFDSDHLPLFCEYAMKNSLR